MTETLPASPAPLTIPGWRHVYSGKVRDLYEPEPGTRDDDAVLVVASDRISAFDYILPTPIPDKGKILTAMSLWWFEQLEGVVANHVISTDVPDVVAGRAMICHRLAMVPVECVVRGYLTGSGLVEYEAGGEVCGVPLPSGLVEASKLPEAIFTPATKAAVGDHDENVSFEVVAEQVGGEVASLLRGTSIAVYSRAAELAAARGIILADTKFEFGFLPGAGLEQGGALILGDEVLTPDSSRFWPAGEWKPGRVTPSFDKQYVRDWLRSPEAGWDRAGGALPPELPAEVVERTRSRYIEAYETLTGLKFQA
ncbi:MAG: phosphoribosylaminoimidazolesuccinocarboxamide synthase [Buchananella hordeovulneris]|nr:phosphoribosylaminoimidazolesuccinocarboxamide synthase [Buchananella hordeovulneris]